MIKILKNVLDFKFLKSSSGALKMYLGVYGILNKINRLEFIFSGK